MSLCRLQYFARKCQAYHSSLQAAVKSSGIEVNDEQVSGVGVKIMNVWWRVKQALYIII